MQDFQLNTYGYPALQDLATVRVPIDKSQEAERWIGQQSANILQSKPTTSTQYNYNWLTNKREATEKPIQAITFQDQTSDRSLINFLRERPNVEENLYRYRPGRPEDALTDRAYDMLTKLKHDATPADYLTKLGMRLPEHIKDPSNAAFERFAFTAATSDSPEMINAGNYAYSRLRDMSEKIGVPVYKLNTPAFAQALGETSSSVDNPERIKYINGFASIRGDGGTDAVYLHRQPGTTPLKYAGTLAHELGHAISAPDHTIAGSRGADRILDVITERISELHAEPIGYGIIRQVLPEIAKRGEYLRSLDFIGRAIPNNYDGGYASANSLVDYFNSPDYQNQIRTAVKYAGQLLA